MWRQIFYLTQVLYITVLVLTKISLVVFYLRVFPDPWLRRATFSMIAVLVCNLIVYGLLISFQCLPVKSMWDENIEGKCLNKLLIIYSGLSSLSFVYEEAYGRSSCLPAFPNIVFLPGFYVGSFMSDITIVVFNGS